MDKIEYVPAHSVPLPDLRDLYGTCSMPSCQCLKSGHWLGRMCANWQPIGFTDLVGHMKWFMYKTDTFKSKGN